jgi:hypothetical protein
MQLVTWNCCRGAWAKKIPLLASLSADIAVVQECPRPENESDTCLWFGDNPRQGIAVLATPPYSLTRLPALDGVPKYIFPIQVHGPKAFTLLAVWSKGRQTYNYVEAVVKAVGMYRSLIEAAPTVLLGDLNSNVIWDATHPTGLNHTALVALLGELKMVSAYHYFHREVAGQETRPTYYFHWKEERPYHIDYCFVPDAWASNIVRADIGSYHEWKVHSDHRPLLVELADGAA